MHVSVDGRWKSSLTGHVRVLSKSRCHRRSPLTLASKLTELATFGRFRVFKLSKTSRTVPLQLSLKNIKRATNNLGVFHQDTTII